MGKVRICKLLLFVVLMSLGEEISPVTPEGINSRVCKVSK